MPLLLIDSETGQVINQINEGDRIVRKNQLDFIKDQEKTPKGETFSKIYHKCIPLLSECGLSASEFMIFIHLATNLRYQSNVAKYGNGRLITRYNIAHDLKMSDKTILRSIRELITQGLIVEADSTEGKVFIVNPFVVSVGDTMSKTIYDLFRKTKWARW